MLAARDEFAENGYRAATVAKIAARADVSVQTLYHAWGSKRDLLRGVLELAMTGDEDVHLDRDERPHALLAGTDPADPGDPERLLAHLVTGSGSSPSAAPASGAPTATPPPSTPTSPPTGRP